MIQNFICLECRATFMADDQTVAACPHCGSDNIRPESKKKLKWLWLSLSFAAAFVIGYFVTDLFFSSTGSLLALQEEDAVSPAVSTEPVDLSPESMQKEIEAIPVIRSVSTPFYSKGSYSFNVTADGDHLEYLLYDEFNTTLVCESSNGRFSDIKPVQNGLYNLVVRNSRNPSYMTSKMISGFDLVEQAQQPVKKVLASELQAAIEGGMTSELYTLTKGARIVVSNPEEGEDTPRNFSEVLNNIPIIWTGATITNVSYDSSNHITSITLTVSR